MKTTVKKTFLDIHKEEEWLNEQGENGLMLTAIMGENMSLRTFPRRSISIRSTCPPTPAERRMSILRFWSRPGSPSLRSMAAGYI
jgi:hypothetical protein